MNLVNMKQSAEEAKEYGAPTLATPAYPYGLCITLDDDSLAKLGISYLPEVGSKLMVVANVVVEAVSETQQQGADKEQRLSLQITDMALSEPTKEIDASAMYPNSQMEK